MQEALLHFIWKNRLISRGNWKSQQGEALELYHSGYHNQHAGPDFTEALVKIGGQRWMGSVEIHVKAREWYVHGHQNDEAYNNVVLHVVWEGDEIPYRADGTPIPQFALKNWVPAELLGQYQRLMQSPELLPCAPMLHEGKEFMPHMFDRAGVERLEQAVGRMRAQLESCKGDWEEAFWRWLAGAFGLRINREPMEALAGSLSVHLLHRYQTQLLSLEALLFGQAGFLNNLPARHQWPARLADEYRYLQAKHNLRPMPPTSWLFLRMRPAGFPTRRLAQLAALLHEGMPLFQRLRESDSPQHLLNQLRVQPSPYWQQHYRLGDTGQGKASSGKPSEETTRVWAINAVLPALFLYGRWQHLPGEEEKAVQWLEKLPPEQNHLIHLFGRWQLSPENALQSQGMVELYKHYCLEKRCLQCIVGNRLLLTKPTEHAKTG
jgi:hypothetical protein